MSSAAELTKQAITAKNAGNASQARSLLIQAVQTDPTYEMAWLWLSSVVDAVEEKRYCVARAWERNPNSEHARRGRESLGDGPERAPQELATDDVAPPPDIGTVQARIVASGRGFACSVCGGAVRPDAEACKHCQRVFAESSVKRGGFWKALGTGALILAVGMCVFFGLAVLSAMGVQSEPNVVVYRIEGRGTDQGHVTYNNVQGGTQQEDVRLPWYKTLERVPSGQFLYISVQNGEDSGSVTCEIVVNGRSYKRSTSNGAYTIAACDGAP